VTDNAETHVAGILTRAYESAIAADRDYVVLIGDLMLDIWLEGQVDRQSPEDPDVPVFFNRGQESSIGAAALVYAHLKTMGMPAVKFITAAANDGPFSFAAKRLNDLENGSDALCVTLEDGATTTTKLRAFDQHEKQRIRIDTEDISPISEDAEDAVLVALRDYIGPQCRLVVVSDYNKGLITDTVMAATPSSGPSSRA
jgi:D-beta-D-heptose 7-phosphate kinase/D-beta-D-heptose 1-phosphate adenosyltransferase